MQIYTFLTQSHMQLDINMLMFMQLRLDVHSNRMKLTQIWGLHYWLMAKTIGSGSYEVKNIFCSYKSSLGLEFPTRVLVRFQNKPSSAKSILTRDKIFLLFYYHRSATGTNHYAGEQQTNYYEKQIVKNKRNASPKLPIRSSQQFF